MELRRRNGSFVGLAIHHGRSLVVCDGIAVQPTVAVGGAAAGAAGAAAGRLCLRLRVLQRHHFAAGFLEFYAQLGENPSGKSITLTDEAKQQVLAAETDEAFSLAERRMRLLCGE